MNNTKTEVKSTNRFNLIDEPWIPVTDNGRVSLKEIFNNPELITLGGNPIQKIALTKLLLAIAQSANTPKNEQAWVELGVNGLAKACLGYLKKWYDHFYLYGDNPFLQMPEIVKAKIQPFGAVLPEVSTANTTVLTQIQQESQLDDADKALLVLQLMGFSLGGKKVDNSVVLSDGYRGKAKTGSCGSSLGFVGFLHSFLQGSNLIETLWINMLTEEQISEIKPYSKGLGTPPWEKMPTSENDDVAQNLTKSLIGRLIPLDRFILLTENGLHYSEGILHLGYKEGMVDPSISVSFNTKTPKAIWVNSDKKPWRMLTALLSFISSMGQDKYNCYQLQFGLFRAQSNIKDIGIWSGGLSVSNTIGEQYASGSNNFIESIIYLPTEFLGESWFIKLQTEMSGLENLSKNLYGCVKGYYKNLTSVGENQAEQATHLFWQLCERRFQDVVNSTEDQTQCYKLRKVFAGYIHQVYNLYCPQDTARQLDAWAQAKPNLHKYLTPKNHF